MKMNKTTLMKTYTKLINHIKTNTADKMDCKKHYDNLMNYRRQNEIQDHYFENHHIIPKCMGGDNSSTNLVKLSYIGHFIAHFLLCEIYKDEAIGYKLGKALNMMSTRSKLTTGRFNLPPLLYELARKRRKDINGNLLSEEKLKVDKKLKDAAKMGAQTAKMNYAKLSPKEKLEVDKKRSNRAKRGKKTAKMNYAKLSPKEKLEVDKKRSDGCKKTTKTKQRKYDKLSPEEKLEANKKLRNVNIKCAIVRKQNYNNLSTKEKLKVDKKRRDGSKRGAKTAKINYENLSPEEKLEANKCKKVDYANRKETFRKNREIKSLFLKSMSNLEFLEYLKNKSQYQKTLLINIKNL